MPSVVSSLGESERNDIAYMNHNLNQANRALTMHDRNKLLVIVLNHDLPCERFCSQFGRLGLRIYDHFEVPIPGERPPLLITVEEEDFLDMRDLSPASDIAWLAFSLFVERERNDELIAFYGLETRQERIYYSH